MDKVKSSVNNKATGKFILPCPCHIIITSVLCKEVGMNGKPLEKFAKR